MRKSRKPKPRRNVRLHTLLDLIELLYHARYDTKELAYILEVSLRTAQRLIKVIKAHEFSRLNLTVDKNGRYLLLKWGEHAD